MVTDDDQKSEEQMTRSREHRLNSLNVSDMLPTHSAHLHQNNNVDSTSASYYRAAEDAECIAGQLHRG